MPRVLLISGSTGIAAAAARLATERGDLPFLAALDPPADYIADLCEEPAAAAAVAACLDRHGRIDALFNVAGLSGRRFGDGPLHECSSDGWDLTFSRNLRPAFLLSREVLRHWLAAGLPGTILHMSSVSAYSPEPQHFGAHAYAAAKGALLSLTKAMAAFYAPHGIRVNAIAPGLVRTPMSARAQSDPDILQFITHKQPLSKGILDADDVARAALFLLGDESRHITGEILTVDGGWSVTG
ncbi:MAG: SDR family oxidoreductase [Bryobacterales bacterium]|nr:SDR family oxidoreductase [Bryobacterales bacterium]